MKMDRYKESLMADVRLIRRNLRNHLVFDEDIKNTQLKLPDSTPNSRWLRQDGSPCNSSEEQDLLRYHAEGWDELTKGKA